jgi:hypothetical protein
MYITGGFDDVFGDVYIQIYEQLKIEEINNEKIDREVKGQEKLDEELERREREKKRK